jgi:hypothetical protein
MYLKSEQLPVGSEAQIAANVPHGAVVVGRATFDQLSRSLAAKGAKAC